ncbi:hypothetical protein D3C76_1515860 [compost metagenome]
MHRVEQAFHLLHEAVLPVIGGAQGLEEYRADRTPQQLRIFGVQRFGADPLITTFADVAIGGQGNGQRIIDQANPRQAFQASASGHQ